MTLSLLYHLDQNTFKYQTEKSLKYFDGGDFLHLLEVLSGLNIRIFICAWSTQLNDKRLCWEYLIFSYDGIIETLLMCIKISMIRVNAQSQNDKHKSQGLREKSRLGKAKKKSVKKKYNAKII